MKKFQKNLFPFFLVIALFCVTVLSGCAENEDLPAHKWLTVAEATGYMYDTQTNTDKKINALKKGFTTDTFSNDKEWDTPSLRYESVFLDVTKNCNLLGMAFEVKTNAIEGFEIFVEVQLYKEISLPSNWEELTDEAKSLWEKENRIKDRQFTSGFVGNRVDGFSVSFTEGKTKLDSSYQIRIYFSTKDFSLEDEEDDTIKDTDYLKNFMIDNFIVLTEGE